MARGELRQAYHDMQILNVNSAETWDVGLCPFGPAATAHCTASHNSVNMMIDCCLYRPHRYPKNPSICKRTKSAYRLIAPRGQTRDPRPRGYPSRTQRASLTNKPNASISTLLETSPPICLEARSHSNPHAGPRASMAQLRRCTGENNTVFANHRLPLVANMWRQS